MAAPTETEFRVADLVREHAASHPDDMALVCEDRSETYGELDRRSNRLAQLLLSLGVSVGDRVAHLDRNDPLAPELLFACAKIGAAVVPLNWRLAPPELVKLLGDARVEVLFHGPGFAEAVDALRAELPQLREVIPAGGELEQRLAGVGDRDPRGDGDGDAVVLQLYTSGTTGLPKGVQITNANLSLLASEVAEQWSIDASSVNLVAMPLFHIGGMGWLLVGLRQRRLQRPDPRDRAALAAGHDRAPARHQRLPGADRAADAGLGARRRGP